MIVNVHLLPKNDIGEMKSKHEQTPLKSLSCSGLGISICGQENNEQL